MNIDYMKRHIKEGSRNFKRNGRMTISAIGTLTFMLLLIAITAMILLNLHHMTKQLEKNVEIRLYLDDSSKGEVQLLMKDIRSIKHVNSVDFISKDEGLEKFIKDFGDEGDAFQTLKEDNPLNNVLVVNTKYPQDVSKVAVQLRSYPLIDKIDYGADIVDPLFKTTKFARMIGLVIIIGFTLIGIHVVSNNIRVTIESRKSEIQLRKLIGASNQFIRFPFMVEGILIGIAGSIFPILLMGIGYRYLYEYIEKDLNVSFIHLITPSDLTSIFSICLLLFGVLIGIWGTVVPLSRKMLKV